MRFDVSSRAFVVSNDAVVALSPDLRALRKTVTTWSGVALGGTAAVWTFPAEEVPDDADEEDDVVPDVSTPLLPEQPIKFAPKITTRPRIQARMEGSQFEAGQLSDVRTVLGRRSLAECRLAVKANAPLANAA